MTEQTLPEVANDTDDDADGIGTSARLDDAAASHNGLSAHNDDTASDLTSGFTDALAHFASHIPFIGRDAARTIRNVGAAALKIEAKFPIIASTIDRIASSIGYVESRNRYDIRGPITKDGDRAYGQHQVMGKYIPAWTKEAIGRSLTPEEFLKDPAAQDAVARVRMGHLYEKYGNVEDVASVWFSGRPLAHNNSHDITGVSVPKYSGLAAKRYGALTAALSQAPKPMNDHITPTILADNDHPRPSSVRHDHDHAGPQPVVRG